MRRCSEGSFVRSNLSGEAPLARLFCFHYAGGGASVFRGWENAFPKGVEVCPIQLPGRENRIKEECYRRMGPLVADLVKELEPYLDCPYFLFGHSMGASLAVELIRSLRRRRSPLPQHLFVSGRRPPYWPKGDEEDAYNLPEDRFVERLREIGGTPEEVLDSKELREMVFPMLRADFEILETFEHPVEEPLDCPITAFGGIGDSKVDRSAIEGWAEHTAGTFAYRMFPGGHFYIRESKDELLIYIRRSLNAYLTCLPTSKAL